MLRNRGRSSHGGAAGLLLLLLFPTVLPAQQPGTREPEADQPGPLAFEYLGPENAGRFTAVAGVPGSREVYFLGAASGGVWKTTDGGETFAPVFDDQPVQAIGALAVAPSDFETVWAGTGEPYAIRDADIMGDGVYKSTDGGQSWTHMGLTETGRIARIVIHPTNPDIVFVCALGRVTGPQQERGVYRTLDGGRSWKRVLFVDEDTGCSGLSLDPTNPDVLFVGTWDTVMHTWVMYSGGPGSGVYVTRDGGDTWARIDDAGLPEPPFGKVDVAVAPSDPDRVYALIQTAAQGSVWRSDDGGASWKVVSWDRTLIGRAGYYIRVAVNPADEDDVLIMNSRAHHSSDGGRTWPVADGCGDCHDVWMDPVDPDHWVVTGDGGVGVTYDHGRSFERWRLPVGQMYHLALDDAVPYRVYSNRQDDGTMRGPSDAPVRVANVPAYGGAAGGGEGRGRGFGAGREEWQGGLGGCESGFTLPKPGDPDIVWASCYGDQVTRYDDDLGRARSVSPWIHTLDSPPADLEYRCHWTPPLAIDPFDPETVYYGCQVIFKTSDEGQTWTVISPDLSTRDPSRIAFSGGIPGAEPEHVIGDNLGQFYGEVVFAIAPSKVRKGLIWAGTNDGLIWLTRDGGEHWTNLTANVTGMPEWGTVRRIEPSRFDPATAYVAVDFHLMDDRDPYIYRTEDFGRSWTRISDGLPHGHPLDYVMAVAENPNRRGMLFAGTGHGFFLSMDDGRTWTRFQRNLPAAPVSWIEVEPRYHDVVISTYGRGLWMLRNITRLEQADRVPADAAAYLYEPRVGFRRARSGKADFLYRLNTAAADPVRFEIADSTGTVVRSFEARGLAGVNHAQWDLLYDGPRQIALRTVPPDNPEIWNEARFRGRDTRPIVHWGTQGPQRVGPLAAPGRYTVRMTVGGESQTRDFRVVADPAIPSSVDDLRASTRAQIRVRRGIDAVADMTNRLEIMRKQIEDLEAENDGSPEALRALQELDRDMMDVELRFLSRTDMHSDDKWYVESYRLYMQYVWLSAEIGLGGGDVQGGAEYRPTAASARWLERLEGELEQAGQAFTELVEQRVPAFNREMAGTLPAIEVPASAVARAAPGRAGR